MQLYSAPVSPFAARVRIALDYKRLPCTLLAPPAAGLKSAEFLALNPIGKIPLLVLDDGSTVPESETILEYLEDAYPERPLRPTDPLRRARMRTVIRVTENYVTPPMVRLFPHLDPASRVQAVVDDELARLQAGLKYLEAYVDHTPYLVDRRPTLADCCVFPTLHLVTIVAASLGVADVFSATPRISRYFIAARSDECLRRAHDEVDAALAAHARK